MEVVKLVISESSALVGKNANTETNLLMRELMEKKIRCSISINDGAINKQPRTFSVGDKLTISLTGGEDEISLKRTADEIRGRA